MNPWGKLGKEYYSWYIDNIEELESYIIHRNIDVDAQDSFWPTLRHQLIYKSGLDAGTLYLCSSDAPEKYHRFAYRATVVF
jgi:hypothetical protein